MAQSLSDVARDHQRRRDALASQTAARAVGLFRRIEASDLDYGWFRVEESLTAVVAVAQVTAARQAAPYTNQVAGLLGAEMAPAVLIPQAFANVTREGREVGPELYSAVARTKELIGKGFGVGQAFRTGTAFMSILAANLVQDAGRSADRTIATGKGFTRSVRVISPGACSRCAILAGVTGYRTNFERHPRCKCTSMPILDGEKPPEGFFSSTDEYFDSLSKAEQERVFTKSGAESIRLGADPMKVVNARRGAEGISYNARGTGRVTPGHLRPVTIGVKADGSPLQVYATTEGTSRRGVYGRRNTTQVRLMPEQIMKQATSPEEARALLKKYGYIN